MASTTPQSDTTSTKPTAQSTKPRIPPLAPFRSRDFGLLWFGGFVSEAGSQMHVVAVSWQVYQLTHNPLALGAIGVARIVPLVLLALGSGVLADALDRRKLMLFSQIAMMLCSASLALASSLGIVTVWWIYVVTALSSAARTLGMPARQAIVPSLVPREHLSSALSLNIISWQAATIMGPTIGGLIIAGWGVSWIYWIDAVSFVAVIVALLIMRVGALIGERRPVSLKAALEGLAFVRGNTLVWSTTLLDFLATFFWLSNSTPPTLCDGYSEGSPSGVRITLCGSLRRGGDSKRGALAPRTAPPPRADPPMGGGALWAVYRGFWPIHGFLALAADVGGGRRIRHG